MFSLISPPFEVPDHSMVLPTLNISFHLNKPEIENLSQTCPYVCLFRVKLTIFLRFLKNNFYFNICYSKGMDGYVQVRTDPVNAKGNKELPGARVTGNYETSDMGEPNSARVLHAFCH